MMQNASMMSTISFALSLALLLYVLLAGALFARLLWVIGIRRST
jgi:hypothetical protein